jgi:hypothetical protein
MAPNSVPQSLFGEEWSQRFKVERLAINRMRRLRPIDFRVVFSRSVVGAQVYELAGESRTRSL